MDSEKQEKFFDLPRPEVEPMLAAINGLQGSSSNHQATTPSSASGLFSSHISLLLKVFFLASEAFSESIFSYSYGSMCDQPVFSDVSNHRFSSSGQDLCTRDTRRDSTIVQTFLDIRFMIGECVGGVWAYPPEKMSTRMSDRLIGIMKKIG